MILNLLVSVVLLSVLQLVLTIVLVVWLQVLYQHDKSRRELVEALEQAFLSKDSKLLSLLNKCCSTDSKK